MHQRLTRPRNRFVGFGLLMVSLAASFGMTHTAHGAPIRYTFSATGSGTLGGNSFTNTFFELTAFADTDFIEEEDKGALTVLDSSANVFITGLGSATFPQPTINADNQDLERVGFSDLLMDLAILFVDSPEFATYELDTEIGPITGTPLFNSEAPFPTDRGDFSLTSVDTATFQATFVPEPGMCSVGMIAAILATRRRSGRGERVKVHRLGEVAIGEHPRSFHPHPSAAWRVP